MVVRAGERGDTVGQRECEDGKQGLTAGSLPQSNLGIESTTSHALQGFSHLPNLYFLSSNEF